MIPKDLDLPKNIEFIETFRELLNRWAYLDCQAEGQAVSVGNFDLERSVELKGRDFQGFLVLRSDSQFGRLLAEWASGEAADEAGAQDAFSELVNQYCGRLQTELWGDAEYHFQGFLPKPSRPADWPKREADRSCLLKAENSFLEIRYWQLA